MNNARALCLILTMATAVAGESRHSYDKQGRRVK